MARVLITGSTTGLGAAAARQLADLGHDVVLHARNQERAAVVGDLASRAVAIAIGDLETRAETRGIADQVNAIGGIDAVIHNAAVYAEGARGMSPEGHPRTLAVNVLAPYLLTAWLEGPNRLVYLSSDMGASGDRTLRDLDWNERRWSGVQAYCDSKLHITTLALALARRWPHRSVNAVNPGWVPTRMGGAGAPDDLELGHRTQTWLAVGDDPDATTSGGYWFHQERTAPPAAALDGAFQDALLDALADLTDVRLP